MDNVLSVPFVFPESVGKQVYKSNAYPRSQWREGKSSAGGNSRMLTECF